MRLERIEGLARERRTFADVGYVGQSHFIEVPLDLQARDPRTALYQAFETVHERINGHKTGETVSYEAPNGKSITVEIISATPYLG